MDDTSDPLNLLEQKVIKPLSRCPCEMTTAAEGTRIDVPEELVEGNVADIQLRELTPHIIFLKLHLQKKYISVNKRARILEM